VIRLGDDGEKEGKKLHQSKEWWKK